MVPHGKNKVYIFCKTNAGAWEKEDKIVKNGTSQFGNVVLVRGVLAVVADYHYDDGNNKTGAVFFYERFLLGKWQQLTYHADARRLWREVLGQSQLY